MGKHVKKKNAGGHEAPRQERSARDSVVEWTEVTFPEEDADLIDDAALLDLDALLAGAEDLLPPEPETPAPELPAEESAAPAPHELPPLPEVVPVAPSELPGKKLPPAPESAGAEERVKTEAPVRRETGAKMPAALRRSEPEKPAGGDAPARKKAAPQPEQPAPKKKNVPAKETASGKAKPSGGSKTSKKKKKKKNRFRRGLLIYVLILAVLIVGVLAYLWVRLDRYQQQKDLEDAEAARAAEELAERQAYEKALYRAPQLAFEAWLAQTDAGYWTDLWYEKEPEDVDGRDRVQAYMEEIFDPAAVRAYKAVDYTDAEPVYVLKNGTDSLARITLSGAELQWSVARTELLVEGSQSASVQVAAGSRVFCNGKELGPQYAGEPTSNFLYEPLRDVLVNPVSWVTYTVDGLLLEPVLTVEAPEGRSVTETAEGDFLLCLEGDTSAYTDKAVAFMRSFLYYYMSGGNGTWGNMYNVLAHLTPGTQAYQDIQNTYDGVYWNTQYQNIDTSDTTAGGVVVWADNCYSVDVTYSAVATNPFTGERSVHEFSPKRVYFVNYGNGFIISNLEDL